MSRLISGAMVLCLVVSTFGGVAVADENPKTTVNAETAGLLETLTSVGKRGKGNVAAMQAYRELVQQDAKVLPAILKAFRNADPLAANWLRGAFETIADRALSDGNRELTAEWAPFVKNTANDPRARSLAFDWISDYDTATANELVPGFLTDPSADLRRVAVARLLEEADELDLTADADKAKSLYQRALTGAVDADQVKEIVAPLKKLGVEVDLPRHFGFLMDWHIAGPFENREGVGFAAVYPPEMQLDLTAEYPTAYDDNFDAKTVTWQPVSTDDDYGVVNIAKSLTNWKGSVSYATTEFDSAKPQAVEFRLGTANAWKLWLNGEELFAREEYHRGMKLDQYRVQANFKAGRNVILLKLCQNEQTQDWAQRYQFQFRVCDGAGSAILSQGK